MTAEILDIGIIVIIGICVLTSYKRGFILSIFDLFSWIISVLLAGWLYPSVSRFLRSTPLYEAIRDSIADTLNFSETVNATTQKLQTELINSINLPDFFKNALLANNNPEIHKLLNVSSVEDYIAAYIAGICINIISVILIIIIVYILIKFLAAALNIISLLPIIHSINKLGGAAIGFFNGTILIWITFTAATFFVSGENYRSFWSALNNSYIAEFFYNTNIILQFITRVT